MEAITNILDAIKRVKDKTYLAPLDSGLLFTNLGTLVAGETTIECICYLRPTNIVLMGTSTHGHLARSVNYGLSFTDLGQMFGETYIQVITYLGNGICIAGTSSHAKILRSTNAGASWTDLGQMYAQAGIFCITNLGGGIVLAGTNNPNGKILRSVNSGATWTDLGTLTGQNRVGCIIHTENGICFAGTRAGCQLWKSFNYGLNWYNLGQIRAGETELSKLVYCGNQIILAITEPNFHIMRSVNNGQTWTDLGSFLTVKVVSANNVHYFGSGIVELGLNNTGGLYSILMRSVDYGATWKTLSIPVINQFKCKSICYIPFGITLAGTNPNGYLLRSVTKEFQNMSLTESEIVNSFDNVRLLN